jgi:hypothetical protein
MHKVFGKKEGYDAAFENRELEFNEEPTNDRWELVFAGISDRQEASSPFDFGSAGIAGKLLFPVGLLKFHLIADRTQMRKIRKVITPAIAISPGQLIYPQLLPKIAIFIHWSDLSLSDHVWLLFQYLP